MNFNQEDLFDSPQEQRKRRMKKADKLKLESRSLHELVVSQNFLVERVLLKSDCRSIPSKSESVLEENNSIELGYNSRLILSVTPQKNDNILVRTLYFDGISEVKSGDRISADIVRYREERIDLDSDIIGPDWNPFSNPNHLLFYLDRDFKEKEDAIELSIFPNSSQNNLNTIRKYRSIEYDRIMNPHPNVKFK